MRALRADKRVASVIFESQQEAYARIVMRWKESPDFVQAIDLRSLPESYRVPLHDPADFAAFRRDYRKKIDVADIVGRVCPANAPVGGVW